MYTKQQEVPTTEIRTTSERSAALATLILRAVRVPLLTAGNGRYGPSVRADLKTEYVLVGAGLFAVCDDDASGDRCKRRRCDHSV